MAPDESRVTSAWEVEHVSWMSACRGVFAEETGTVWQQHVKILHWKSCQCEKRITHATGFARTLWDVHQVEDRSCFHHPVVAMTTLWFCYAEQTLVVCPPPPPPPCPVWGCRTCEDICTLWGYLCVHVRTHRDMLKSIEKISSLNCWMLYIWVLKL